jgi:hypothetical protein
MSYYHIIDWAANASKEQHGKAPDYKGLLRRHTFDFYVCAVRIFGRLFRVLETEF